MIILTLRTDKPKAEIGLFRGHEQLTYEAWQAHRQLAETLHHKITELLSFQGLALKDVEGIVVFKGPGSFTGLRIGLSVANALAYGLPCPIVGQTGDTWVNEGIEQLSIGKNYALVAPDYGSPVHITQPRK